MATRLLNIGLSVIVGALLVLRPSPCCSDTFQFVDSDGNQVELEAHLVVATEGTYILGTPDGQYHLVPRSAARGRVASDGPAPLDGQEMSAQLEKEFTAERFRSYVQKPFVIGLVLGSPLPRTSEGQAKALMRNVATFMKNVEGAFGRYVRDTRIDAPRPTHPVVVLVFEARDDFEQYAARATRRDEEETKRIAGFYSKLTNILAIRLEECRTFETPLHEAIHQQSQWASGQLPVPVFGE